MILIYFFLFVFFLKMYIEYMRIFITDMYINAQHMTEHSVDEILHHKNHKNQSREFILDKLRPY